MLKRLLFFDKQKGYQKQAKTRGFLIEINKRVKKFNFFASKKFFIDQLVRYKNIIKSVFLPKKFVFLTKYYQYTLRKNLENNYLFVKMIAEENMKLVIASDIHGSVYYTQKLINRFESEKGDKLILLGDYYYHGPRNPLTQDYNPAQVADILNRYVDKIVAIKGNCDSEVDQMISKFKIKSRVDLDFEGKIITLMHGHKYDKNKLPPFCGDIFLYGHFHIPFVEESNGIIIASPGSVSLPKSNSKNTYMTIENGLMLIKSLDGEIIYKKKI